MTALKHVVFFTRAYNDLDTQLPLIDALAGNPSISVSVLGYPCDSDLYDPTDHEFYPYFQSINKLEFSTLLDRPEAPLFLRIMQKGVRLLTRLRKAIPKTSLLFTFVRILHVASLILQRKFLKKYYAFYSEILSNLAPDLIIIDEVIFMASRSAFIDQAILKYKAAHKTPIISIQTGQLIYYDPFPNKGKTLAEHLQFINYRTLDIEDFLLPSVIDREAIKITFPQESPEILGNLRMDKRWIQRIHNDILPHPNTAKKLQKFPSLLRASEDSLKVVFMLSKIGYGIEVEALINTINAVTKLNHVTTAIKPHTRGMKLDFLKKDQANKLIDVTNVPSSELLEWADIVLFTGSGIAFHQMALGKAAGYLKYCQNIDGIFNQCPAVETLNSQEELISYLENFSSKDQKHHEKNIAGIKDQWLRDFVYAGKQSTIDEYVKRANKNLNL